RFTTSHPLEFSDRLIEVFGSTPKLANYLHLPVQSGSDRVLAAMKRGHTALEYKAKIRRLRELRPDISLSSDFIVGFPGETERDYGETLKLIDDVRFDQAFSFIYSRRPGTPAAGYHDDVGHNEKVRRLEALQARIHAHGQAYMRAQVGTRQRVLVEKLSERDPHEVAGKTECNRWVNFPGDARLIGQFVPVDITHAMMNSYRGRLSAARDAA
ncbi:MAG TPA: TRAM domain-containing protein, partial [Gammaproteobacteria bacterium]|nr:TRAM domain-containing protein [Gammaproteobacteria bacterium]